MAIVCKIVLIKILSEIVYCLDMLQKITFGKSSSDGFGTEGSGTAVM